MAKIYKELIYTAINLLILIAICTRKQLIAIYFNILYNIFAKRTIYNYYYILTIIIIIIIDILEIIKYLFRKEY